MKGYNLVILLACWLFPCQASAWAGSDKEVDNARIAQLIEQLGNDRFSAREEASKALEAIGKPALNSLREAAARNTDPEIRRRAGILVDRMDTTAPEQLAAAAEIVKLGGKVEFDRNSPGKPVVTVHLDHPKVTDDDLKHLEKLTGLRSLVLSHITDVGMEHLKDLTQLQSLTIHSAKITDKGLKHLKTMQQLQSLYFSCLFGPKDNVVGLPLTDKGLEELKGLTQLKTLKISLSGRFGALGIEELQKALPKTRIIIN